MGQGWGKEGQLRAPGWADSTNCWWVAGAAPLGPAGRTQYKRAGSCTAGAALLGQASATANCRCNAPTCDGDGGPSKGQTCRAGGLEHELGVGPSISHHQAQLAGRRDGKLRPVLHGKVQEEAGQGYRRLVDARSRRRSETCPGNHLAHSTVGTAGRASNHHDASPCCSGRFGWRWGTAWGCTCSLRQSALESSRLAPAPSWCCGRGTWRQTCRVASCS